jgi:hypothetical protein
MTLADAIGWTATAVFTASYFATGQARLRRVQMAGATLWLTYGLVMHAAPVIGANILVLSAACWAEYRGRRGRPVPQASPRDGSATAGASTAGAEAA